MATPAKKIPVPVDSRNSLLWRKVKGFREWISQHGPGSTNKELAEAIGERYALPTPMTRAGVESLRKYYGAPMNDAARRRAIEARPKAGRKAPASPPDDGLTPTQRMDAAAMQAHIRRLTHKQTFFELVGEKILAAVREIPQLPPVTQARVKIGRQLDEEEHVLFISDVQAGLVLGSQESGGLSSFNSQILLGEVDFLAKTVVGMKPYQPNAKKLNVFFGGDIVENEVIFPGQTREIDQNVMNQVLFCVEHFARLLHTCLQAYDEVECWVVVGNHGRIGGKPGEHDPMSNFDWLVGRMLQERTRNLKQIKWNIPDTWWALPNILGFNFLLVHGDDVGGGYAGIPFYGSERSRTRFQDMFQVQARMSGTDVPVIHRMCIGHFSEPAAFYTTIMNGSWPGGTSFSTKRLQRTAIPSQKMWAVHPRWGVTWMRDIVLRQLP